MSLNWELSGIQDWQNVCFEDWNVKTGKGTLSDVTNNLIWACLLLDMGGLKDEAAALEMAWRFNFVKALGETYWKVWDGEEDHAWWPSADDLRRHIGLRTNVSQLSRTKFINKRVSRLKEKAERATLDQMS